MVIFTLQHGAWNTSHTTSLSTVNADVHFALHYPDFASRAARTSVRWIYEI